MGQNTTERALRGNILSSPARDFDGYRLAVHCGTAECGGERAYNVADLASMYGGDKLMGAMIAHMRCHRCGGPARTCFIETGPELAKRARMRRVALMGPEGRTDGR